MGKKNIGYDKSSTHMDREVEKMLGYYLENVDKKYEPIFLVLYNLKSRIDGYCFNNLLDDFQHDIDGMIEACAEEIYERLCSE